MSAFHTMTSQQFTHASVVATLSVKLARHVGHGSSPEDYLEAAIELIEQAHQVIYTKEK